MKILVDTHALIWFLGADTRLSEQARAMLDDDEVQAFVSAATTWEMGIKHALGRLRGAAATDREASAMIASGTLRGLDISHGHARRAAALPMLLSDPFDRMLIAQALVEDMAIVTADRRFAEYGVSVIW